MTEKIKKRRNRNQEALVNMEAKRLMLKEAAAALDALAVRLSMALVWTLQDRPEELLAKVVADMEGTTRVLTAASHTALTIKRLLHDPSPQANHVVVVLAVQNWLDTRDDHLPAWRRWLVRRGRSAATLLGTPRRWWRGWRAKAQERQFAEWLAGRQAAAQTIMQASPDSEELAEGGDDGR